MRSVYFVIILLTITMLALACVGDEVDTEQTQQGDAIDQGVKGIDDSGGSTFDEQILLAIGEWPPYTSKDLPEYGFAAEIVKKSFANVGIGVKYEFYPWPRTLVLAEGLNVDGTFPWIPEKKGTIFDITDTFCTNEEKFIYLKGNKNLPVDFSSAIDLQGVRVGAVAPYAQVDIMTELGIEFEITNNDLSAVKKVMEGRLDTFPINPLVAMKLVKDTYPSRVDEIMFLETPLIHKEMGILISNKHSKQEYYIQKFNEGYKELISSGDLNKIFIKHDIEFLIEMIIED